MAPSSLAPFIPRDADARDRGFYEYWLSRLDLSDPAAPHWLEHFAERNAECRKMADAIERYLPLAGARALDVGCQTGALAVTLAERGARVTGIDLHDWVLEAARRRAAGWGVTARFEPGRGEALPHPDASFDLVTFVDVIEHCDDAGACLREAARVLRPGGVLYVLGPNRFAPAWFVRDPHYQLAFASVMPRGLGRRYVEWRRDKPGYDVGEFPVGNLVVRVLERAGLTVLDSPAHAAQRWVAGRAPAALAPRLAPVARAWGALRLFAVPTFVLVARKPAATDARDGSAGDRAAEARA